jgi:alpha-methylacyl-CoA racemase
VTHGPLAGLRVIELAGIGPGPFTCNFLADLGATVVRVERAGGSNALPDAMAAIGRRERVTLSLNLKEANDRSIATTVIEGADVLVEGFRPGVAERLGIGPEAMCETNRSLIYVRMTGWGQVGPYASMAGHDINYIGLAGALAAIGTSQMPLPPLNLVGDYGGGGMFAVVGILAALFERSITGSGQVIDVAMVDGTATLMGPVRDLFNAGVWSAERASNFLDGGAPFYRCYETSDGRFVAVGALEPQFYSELISGLGLGEDDLPNRFDRENWPSLSERFAAMFAQRSRDEWTEVFDGTDACVTPVLALDEVASHPHNHERRALRESTAGPVPAIAPRFEGFDASSAVAGMDAESVPDVLEAMGLPRHVIDALVVDGTIGTT